MSKPAGTDNLTPEQREARKLRNAARRARQLARLTETTAVRLGPQELGALERLGRSESRGRSDLIRRAIREYAERRAGARA